METRRLELLAELYRLGSMRAVADALGTSTSTVSQQIAVLASESASADQAQGQQAGPADARGREAFQARALTILAAVEAAAYDLGPGATSPGGTLRVAGFATAIRQFLLPVVASLTASHPLVHVLIRDAQTAEALELPTRPTWPSPTSTTSPRPPPTQPSAALACGPRGGASACPPAKPPPTAPPWRSSPASTRTTGLATPATPPTKTCPARSASHGRVHPRILHQADSLDLVLLVQSTAGLGVGLLPLGQETRPGVGLTSPCRAPEGRDAGIRRCPPRPPPLGQPPLRAGDGLPAR